MRIVYLITVEIKVLDVDMADRQHLHCIQSSSLTLIRAAVKQPHKTTATWHYHNNPFFKSQCTRLLNSKLCDIVVDDYDDVVVVDVVATFFR